MMHYKTQPNLIYADYQKDTLSFVITHTKGVSLFKIKHMEPREYLLPENLKEHLNGAIKRLFLSETGNYIFATSEDVACIYKKGNEEPIYTYEK